MQKKIVGIIICILLFTTFAGAVSPSYNSTKSKNSEPVTAATTHTVLSEFGTYTTCTYCKYAHEALIYLFFNRGDDYPFYYVTHVYDVNAHAYSRVKGELGLTSSPTVYWDGGWRKDIGSPDNATAVANYKKSINRCKNRTVADIDLSVDGYWLGAVNNEPKDDSNNVSINKILKWTNSQFMVNVSVTNNKASQYNGHIHVYVCDNQSSMDWYDTAGRLYTMTFLDYAFNNNTALGAGTTWTDSTIWDGTTRSNGTHFYEDVTEGNTWVIASVFDRDNDDYSDETAGYRLGKGTDPKTFTVYFGNTTPPPLGIENISVMSYLPGQLVFNTTYYWKVDVWNKKGEKTKGKILEFKTRGNKPPNPPENPYPWNDSTGYPIKINFSWQCEDPDGDNMTYDIYLGEYNPPNSNQTLIAENISVPWFEHTELLDFLTWYEWRVVAKDEWDDDFGNYNTSSLNWTFKTEANLPPNKASDPFPSNESENIPTSITLRWNGSDPNYGDPLKYDFYFGPSSDPNLWYDNRTVNYTKPPYNLVENETYYWKINTWDRDGLKSKGDLWWFNTGRNDRPIVITIDGPTQVKPNEEHEYTFIATDRENDSVSYYIEWGDGTITNWTPWQPAGPPGYTESHSWAKKGTYQINCTAKDKYGEGDRATLKVSVPRNKALNINSYFIKFLEKHLYLFPLLRRILGL